jgi:hypothetical protein
MHTTKIVEMPFTEWHKAASVIMSAGAIVASGFWQGTVNGDIVTYTTSVPAIYVGDTVFTPAPIVP